MDNSNAAKPAGEGLSPAIELMGRITEEAVNEGIGKRKIKCWKEIVAYYESK